MLHLIDPRTAGTQDVVGVGEDFSSETLVAAYRLGVFPWPMEGLPLLWFCPMQRAVLDFDRLHVPSRLARLQRNTPLSFTIDTAFDQVMAACKFAPRPGQDGTWISEAMQKAYAKLHALGYAHSVEAWDTEGKLMGGLYGVEVEGVFSGESMFHAVPNASKLALLFLIDHLRARGAAWMDIQVMTPHFAALGAVEIPRDEFLDRLEETHQRGLQFFGPLRRY